MTRPAADPLALESQVCFALAVASRNVVAAYRSVLEPLGLTHPQYLVMLALWEHQTSSVRELAGLLHLESATVTPLLKRLEERGLVSRQRSSTDERVVVATLTSRGQDLREGALRVPAAMLQRMEMDADDLTSINGTLNRIIAAASAAR